MVTAARFLELFLEAGGDCYLRRDGRVVLKGPRRLLDGIGPKLTQIGRGALVAELEKQDGESLARLARILPHRADVPSSPSSRGIP